MLFRHDRRGQSVVVGTVILFGFLILALSLYQVQVVPVENADVEFEHSQQTERQFLDLRNNVLNTATTGESRSTAINLGTRYPQRTVTINPSPPSGTVETTEANNIEITAAIDSESVTDPNIEAFWDTDPQFETRSIQYTPQYNEFRDPPQLTYEHSIVSAEFDSATLLRSGQTLVRDDRVSLPTLTGTISETGLQSSSIDSEVISQQSRTVPITGDEGTLEIRLPTAVNDVAELASRFDIPAAQDVRADTENNAVVITLDPDQVYQLGLSAVSVDGSGQSEPQYLVPTDGFAGERTITEGQRVGIEVRDIYNNPVPRATVEIDGEDRRTNDDGRVFVDAETPGTLTIQLPTEDPDPHEKVIFTVRAGGEGSGDPAVGPNITVGPSDQDVTASPDETIELGDRDGGDISISGNVNNIGIDRLRSGTPIQAIWYNVEGPSGDLVVEDTQYATFNPDLSDRVFSFDDIDPDVVTNETQIDASELEEGENTLRLFAQDASGRFTPDGEQATVTVTVEEDEPVAGPITNATISDVGANVDADDNEVQDVRFELQESGLDSGETVTIDLDEAQRAQGGGGGGGSVDYLDIDDGDVNVIAGDGDAAIANTNRGQGEADLVYTSNGDSTGEIVIEIVGYETDDEDGPYSISFTRDDTGDDDSDTFSVVETAPVFVGDDREIETIQGGVNRAGEGGDVNIDAGVYAESVQVSEQDITIRGRDGTVVNPPGNGAGYTINADGVSLTSMEITDSGDAIVTNAERDQLTVRDTIIRDSTRGVVFNDDSDSVTLDATTIQDVNEDGVVFNGEIDEPSVSNSEFMNVGGNGLVFNNEADGVSIDATMISNTDGDGVLFNSELETATIDNTTVSGAGGNGLRFNDEVSETTFSANVFETATNNGLLFNNEASDLTFTSNMFRENDDFGLRFNDECGISGSENTFTDNGNGDFTSGCNPNT